MDLWFRENVCDFGFEHKYSRFLLFCKGNGFLNGVVSNLKRLKDSSSCELYCSGAEYDEGALYDEREYAEAEGDEDENSFLRSNFSTRLFKSSA